MASVVREYAIDPLWLLYGAAGHAIAAGKGDDRRRGLLLALVHSSGN